MTGKPLAARRAAKTTDPLLSRRSLLMQAMLGAAAFTTGCGSLRPAVASESESESGSRSGLRATACRA